MKIHWTVYVLGTIVFWGAYVPTIHLGQMGFGEHRGPIRAFLFVGLAYFLVAVLVPGLLLFVWKQEPAVFPTRGMAISALAGVLGAAGALGVILALTSGGKAWIVPPLVFAGAPIMSVVVNMVIHKPDVWPRWPFYAGIVMAAVGAAVALRYKPA